MECSHTYRMSRINSDYDYATTKLEVKAPKRNRKSKMVTRLSKFMDLDAKMKFNEKLESMLRPCSDVEHKEFCDYMLVFSKEEAREPINSDEGWLELSKDELIPLIKTGKKLLRESKLFEGSNKPLKQKHRDVRENSKYTKQLDKGK